MDPKAWCFNLPKNGTQRLRHLLMQFFTTTCFSISLTFGNFLVANGQLVFLVLLNGCWGGSFFWICGISVVWGNACSFVLVRFVCSNDVHSRVSLKITGLSRLHVAFKKGTSTQKVCIIVFTEVQVQEFYRCKGVDNTPNKVDGK